MKADGTDDEDAPAAREVRDSGDSRSDALPLTAQLEAMLFVSDGGLSAERMAAVAAVPVDTILQALESLGQQLADRSSGLALRNVSSGWRLTTAPDCAPLLERFVIEGQSGRLSPAALETLAVVAYRQPVSRGRIAAIRGVAVDGVVRTLLARGLVSEVGTEASGATLFAVTQLFLDKIGVDDVTDLPSLAPLLPDLETIDEPNVQPELVGAHSESTRGEGVLYAAETDRSGANQSDSDLAGGTLAAGEPDDRRQDDRLRTSL